MKQSPKALPRTEYSYQAALARTSTWGRWQDKPAEKQPNDRGRSGVRDAWFQEEQSRAHSCAGGSAAPSRCGGGHKVGGSCSGATRARQSTWGRWQCKPAEKQPNDRGRSGVRDAWFQEEQSRARSCAGGTAATSRCRGGHTEQVQRRARCAAEAAAAPTADRGWRAEGGLRGRLRVISWRRHDGGKKPYHPAWRRRARA